MVGVFNACSGSSSSSNDDEVAIAIYPQSVTLPVSTSQQFSATVTGSTNTEVTWQVNGTTGGSATYGLISTAGLYTAPSTVPTGSVTVTAIAKADTSKTASATVTLSNANTLVISPTQATVPAGGQQTFTATLGGLAMDAEWTITCTSSASDCGTISASGIYTAPLSPPIGRSVSVQASSKNADAANASIVVTFGGGTLIGQYSFAMTGVESGQPYRSVGSITFDGKGGITGGTEDRYGSATPVTITGGTYVSDSQGRIAASIHTEAGDESWQITLVDHSRALVMRTDSVIARGDMDLQNTLHFGQFLNGAFSFRLAGTASSGDSSVHGMAGALALDQQGNITSGVLDSNNGGTVSTNVPVSGTSTASNSSDGRGTISLTSSLGTQTYAYYVINSTTAKLMEIDGVHDLSGKLVMRSSSTITPRDFSGKYAFVFSGANKDGAVGQGGTFTIDQYGNITNGALDRSTDTSFALGFLFSGALVVADPAMGRSVVTFNVGGTTLQYVVYPPSLNCNNYELAFLEIDNENVTSGLALRQQSTDYAGSLPSFTGHVALLAGETTGAVQQTISGPIRMASTPTGVLDRAQGGNITLGTALQSSQFSVNSLYGRGQLLLRTDSYSATYMTYIVDNNSMLLLQADGKGVQTGVMQRQY